MRLACEKIVEMATARAASGGGGFESSRGGTARESGGGSDLGCDRPSEDPLPVAAEASTGISPQVQQQEQQRRGSLSYFGGIDMVVVEAELKVALGYRNKDGHRAWRKIKVRHACGCVQWEAGIRVSRLSDVYFPGIWCCCQGRLEGIGVIETFLGRVMGKAVICVRLLKQYNPTTTTKGGGKRKGGGGRGDAAADEDDGGAPEDGNEDKEGGGGDDGDDEAAAGSSVPNLMVEVPLERQMLELVAQAGPTGIVSKEVG